MDLGTLSNGAALLFSGGALILSVLFTRRQLRLAHGSNMMLLLGSTFESLRTTKFYDAQDYIYERMQEHDPSGGFRGLPVDVKEKVLLVTLFYNDLGRLVVHGALSEKAVLSSFGEAIRQTWEILHEFVEADRLVYPFKFMLYYEDMACRMRDRGNFDIVREFKLRTW
jgi:hypothetical protein